MGSNGAFVGSDPVSLDLGLTQLEVLLAHVSHAFVAGGDSKGFRTATTKEKSPSSTGFFLERETRFELATFSLGS